MNNIRKFLGSSYWSIFSEKKLENTFSLVSNLIANTTAALLEGLSFGFILLALNALNGDLVSKIEKFPILNFVSWKAFSSQDLFSIFVIASISLQIVRSIFTYWGQKFMTQMSTRFQIGLEKKIYEKIFSLAFANISRYKPGDLVEAVQTPGKIYGVLDALNRILVCIFNTIAFVALLFLISPQLTICLLSLLSVIYLAQKFIFRIITSKSSILTDELADFNQYTFQCLNGLRTIFTFNRQNYIHEKVKKKAQLIGEMSGKLYLLQFSLGPLNEIFGILTVGICMILGPFIFVGSKEVILPSLLTFITVAYRLVTKLQGGVIGIATVSYFSGFFSHLNAFLQKKDQNDLKMSGKKFQEFSHVLEFQDVSFKHENNLDLTISNFSFSLPKGNFLALVGTSGSGKSTLADLLIGLYKPMDGKISVDGVDLRTYNLDSWKDCLGVVSQDTFLLNSTVEENIQFGCEDKSELDVIRAAKEAHAHEFILKLPLGYKTVLGAHGHQLSGGEKQRISLARALVRQPQILILDEATSHLDSHSETVIHETLKCLYRKKTLVVIAHRLSSVVHADQILVLEEGKIVERGTHEELLASGEKYAHFWQLQQKKSETTEPLFRESL